MSGYFLRTSLPISLIGFLTPVEDSLWQTVNVSYSSVSSFAAIISGLTALPHSTSRTSVFLPHARNVSAHRWEKAPFTHANAFCLTILLPTMSNQSVPEEVVTVGLTSAGNSKYLLSLAVTPLYRSENSFSL